MTTILKGNIVSAPSLGRLDVTENGYLIAENGVITGVYPVLPEQYAGAAVEDCGDALIVQSFADLHLHAPQYPMLGMGMDLPLLDWLNAYAFPTEARFADPDYARTVYRQLAQELAAHGTTRVCMFSSLHTDATLILMAELERAGITGYVGKVNMDRNAAPGVLEETTEESMRETLPVQSHLSENSAEMKWVRQLHPDCRQYWETYAKYGLWNERTVMAHCVWSDSRERQAMKDAGVTVVHCADSNQNICSGIAPVRVMLDEGLKVALGSDIAGGDHLDFFDVTASAIRASKARRMMDGWETPFLTVAESWYLATSAGAAYFGEKPGFAAGNPLHAMVLADDTLPAARPLTPAERLERAVYRRQEGAVRAVWSAGKKIYTADEKGQRSKP